MSFGLINNHPIYSDLVDIKLRKLRFFIDLQFLSRIYSYNLIPDLRHSHFIKVLNFGSGLKKEIEFKINATEVHHEDLLLKNPVLGEPNLLNSYDLILAIEVLEHIPNIDNLLSRFHSLLRDHGFLLITMPFLAREHGAPNDYLRFTLWGLTELLKQNGFSIKYEFKRGGIISVVSTFINYSVYRASFFTKVLISPLFPFFFLLHLFAHIEVFVLRKGRDQKYYLGVTVFAQKVS